MGRKAGIDIIGVGPMRCQPVRLLPTLYGEVRGILSTRYPCSPSRGARWEVSRACDAHSLSGTCFKQVQYTIKLTINIYTSPLFNLNIHALYLRIYAPEGCQHGTHTHGTTRFIYIVCPAPRGGRRNGAGRDNRRRTAKPCSAGSFGASE